MTRKRGTITIDTRVRENPGEFRFDNGILFCNFCELSVEWKSKSTVDSHCLLKGHIKKSKYMKIMNMQRSKLVC